MGLIVAGYVSFSGTGPSLISFAMETRGGDNAETPRDK